MRERELFSFLSKHSLLLSATSSCATAFIPRVRLSWTARRHREPNIHATFGAQILLASTCGSDKQPERIVIGDDEAGTGLRFAIKSHALLWGQGNPRNTFKYQHNEERKAAVSLLAIQRMVHVELCPSRVVQLTQLPRRELGFQTVHQPGANGNCIRCYTSQKAITSARGHTHYMPSEAQ